MVDTNRVRRIRNGNVDLFAGDVNATALGDGGPAINAQLNARGVAVDSAGVVYIADLSNNGRVRKVGLDGTITTFAGGGTNLKDGIPALQAQISGPVSVAADASGNIYVADIATVSVRVIAADGTIRTTVAGNGTGGFSGDVHPATTASIGSILGIAVDNLGNLFIADGENLRLRKVGPDGIIQTIAGVGQTRFSGDGGPATQATFGQIGGMTLDRFGNLYVSDAKNNVIRRINKGIIQTVAGTGIAGDTGDEGPATSATLLDPEELSAAPDGTLFFAERSAGAHRIRKITPDGVIHAEAGEA